MYIPNNDTQNHIFYRLKLVVETFEHSSSWTNHLKYTKVPKVVKLTNKKMILKEFGEKCNKQSIVPSHSLFFKGIFIQKGSQ